VGASRTELYLQMLQNKKVGIVANQSSLVGKTHLVDTLVSSGIDIVKIFTPEHGFRGTSAEGEHVDDGTDPRTGIRIISLYGKNRKPTAEQMEDIDIMLFDLQDVGVRFYTYISTMSYVMEACAENNVRFIVLDRPNPNGFYIDGPIMEDKYKSFVGMHNVPIVYGMTIGEYAQMVNGEGMLQDEAVCDLTVIPMGNYCRDKIYKLPVKPSPNLPNWQSVYLYPSLCLFEGTVVSVGRGTETPFQCYGHPKMTGSHEFTPKKSGRYTPPYSDELCRGEIIEVNDINGQINLNYLIEAYRQLESEPAFFNNYFEKLVGTDRLRSQIENNVTTDSIRASWKEGVDAFKQIRTKYLIYSDFGQ